MSAHVHVACTCVHECVLSHGLLKCVFGAGWAKGRNKWGPVQHWDCCMNHQGTYTVYRKRRPQLTALSLEVDHFPCNTEGNGVINSKNLRGFGSATKHNYDLIMWKKGGDVYWRKINGSQWELFSAALQLFRPNIEHLFFFFLELALNQIPMHKCAYVVCLPAENKRISRGEVRQMFGGHTHTF